MLFVVLVIENAGTFYHHPLEFKIRCLQINWSSCLDSYSQNKFASAGWPTWPILCTHEVYDVLALTSLCFARGEVIGKLSCLLFSCLREHILTFTWPSEYDACAGDSKFYRWVGGWKRALVVCQDKYTALFKKWGGGATPSILIDALKAGKDRDLSALRSERACLAGERRDSTTREWAQVTYDRYSRARCCQLPDQGKWSPNNRLSHIYWGDHGTKAVDRRPCGGWHSHCSYHPISSVPLSSSDGLCGMWVKKTKHRFHFHIILQQAVLTLQKQVCIGNLLLTGILCLTFPIE